MSFFQFLTGNKASSEVEAYKTKGAVIIDVRSESEFLSGHVPGSVNIPLPNLGKEMNRIKKMNKPVIAVCASGNRSGMALGQLKAAGIDAINGGGWRSLA